MDIQWYPGHMTKARRQLKEKLGLIDIVIEVLDARAPQSSLNPDFDDLFARKTRMYLLNKADLADSAVTARWVKYFRKKGIAAVPFSAARGNTAQLKKDILAGAEALLRRYRQKGVKKTLRGLVAGIPNVGKSAILNRLSGGRKLKEGNKPGVTKALQWAKIDQYLEIMDSPGLLWPKFKDERTAAVVALIGSVKLDILDEEALALYLIGLLRQNAPQMLMERYRLAELPHDDYEVLAAVAKNRGFLVRGGEADAERAAKTLLDEFKNGKMGKITLELPEE